MAKQPGKDLQAAIRAKGHDWQAAATSVSELSAAEQKSRLGLSVTKAELEATAKAIQAATAMRALHAPPAAPVAVDWRNNNGDWTTAIRDQASCGSCVAFGTVATLEARVKLACKSASMTPDLSEADLFYCGCGNCCNTGWNFPPALDRCKNTGVALESAFPYTPGNQPCKQGLTPWVKITGWSSVLPVADRKNTIATKGPVVAGMAVYQDFFSYHSGVYHHVSGNLAGYHAVSVVGYDDTQKCWIAKNSWGPGWGESGWFRIGYGESGIDTSFPFYDMDVACPVRPIDECRRYVPFLVQVIQAARTNPRLRACLRYYVCRLGLRPYCAPLYIRVIQTVIVILRRCPQYRDVFCRAVR